MFKWLDHKTNIADLINDIEQSLHEIEMPDALTLEKNIADALRQRGWNIQINEIHNPLQVPCDYIAQKESIRIPIEVKFLRKNALVSNTKSTYYIWQQVYRFEQFLENRHESIRSALVVVVTNDDFYQSPDVLSPIGTGRMRPEIVSRFGYPHLLINKSYNIEWKRMNDEYKMLIIQVMR